jgi:hypothetical protein
MSVSPPIDRITHYSNNRADHPLVADFEGCRVKRKPQLANRIIMRQRAMQARVFRDI